MTRANLSLPMAAAALAAVAIAACGGEQASAAGRATVTDSAGVRIVVNPPEDRELQWTFEQQGLFADSLGEPWLFTQVHPRGVGVGSNGTVYVLDGQVQVVERFASDGAYLGSIGRKGGGPGEFEFPTGVSVRGDTLLVRDFRKGGFARLRADGEPLADLRLSDELQFVNDLQFHSRGLWMSGSLRDSLVRGIGFFTDTAQVEPLHVQVNAPGKDVRYSCIAMQGAEPLFSPRLLWSSSADRAVVVRQPGYVLWVYDGDSLALSARRDLATRPPTLDDVKQLYPDGWKIQMFGGGGARECVVDAEEMAAQQGLAAELPLVQNVVVLADGTIVAQRKIASATEQVLDIFTADGVYVGTQRGMRLPVAVLPTGEWLVPQEDEDSGGTVLARVRVRK